MAFFEPSYLPSNVWVRIVDFLPDLNDKLRLESVCCFLRGIVLHYFRCFISCLEVFGTNSSVTMDHYFGEEATPARGLVKVNRFTAVQYGQVECLMLAVLRRADLKRICLTWDSRGSTLSKAEVDVLLEDLLKTFGEDEEFKRHKVESIRLCGLIARHPLTCCPLEVFKHSLRIVEVVSWGVIPGNEFFVGHFWNALERLQKLESLKIEPDRQTTVKLFDGWVEIQEEPDTVTSAVTLIEALRGKSLVHLDLEGFNFSAKIYLQLLASIPTRLKTLVLSNNQTEVLDQMLAVERHTGYLGELETLVGTVSAEFFRQIPALCPTLRLLSCRDKSLPTEQVARFVCDFLRIHREEAAEEKIRLTLEVDDSISRYCYEQFPQLVLRSYVGKMDEARPILNAADPEWKRRYEGFCTVFKFRAGNAQVLVLNDSERYSEPSTPGSDSCSDSSSDSDSESSMTTDDEP